MRRRSAHRTALLLASGAASIAVGCGSAHKPTPVGLQLQREDLVLAARTLTSVEPALEREGRASKAAWPLILAGLPPAVGQATRSRIHQSALLAQALPLPVIFGEERARSLTGAAADLAGSYQTFHALASRGWRLVDYSSMQTAQGTRAAASFARSNVALYVESIYDGQFVIAQLGKQLAAAFKRLGGPAAFGATLTQAEVDQLAGVYSERVFRLEPHATVRLGS